MKKLKNVFTKKEFREILNKIQICSKEWEEFCEIEKGGCLDNCPGWSTCYKGIGPEGVCSEKWGDANLSIETLAVLQHIYENLKHYNPYKKNSIPSLSRNPSTLNELRRFISKQIETQLDNDYKEDDEIQKGKEDLTAIRTHKKYDRNPTLVSDAKKYHGYVCKACNCNFEKTYGDIGKEFIEAHHLIPFSKLKGKKKYLDPKKDFTVLCANCHRMIHRSEYISDIDAFKKAHVKK